jgi:uncharacterized repeat protein (TIGR03803 family)
MARFSRLSAGCILAFAAAFVQPADAAGFKVLYTFQGMSEGGNPYAGVIADAKGDLYTTTSVDGQAGAGTVFELSKKGIGAPLYAFRGSPGDGSFPQSPLIMNKGNFFGTTSYGGSANLGTIFELKKDGIETVLHSFTGGKDGENPSSGLIEDSKSNLYGTTFMGGSSNNCGLGAGGCGTIFKISKNGKEKRLHVFAGSDGSYPSSALLADAQGNLYGTTALGGQSVYGTVFMLAPNGTLTTLYSFTNGSDGGIPGGGLTADATGNLYGTTETGGDASCGCGTIFKLTPGGTESTLYAFMGGSDGAEPFAGLTSDSSGNLYGTTKYGGSTNKCTEQGPTGCGTVYELPAGGTEQVLYAFSGINDGAFPYGNLLLTHGKLIGTAEAGGSINNAGSVFEVTP